MADIGHRDLDKTTSSMSVFELNNMIVCFRKIVKESKVRVIHRLTSQKEKLLKKKGTEEMVSSNKMKAERLVREIHTLKHLNPDQIAKFSLANTQNVEEAAKVVNMEMKVMTRVACEKPMQNKINKWREEHEDWRALAAFVLTKNTGRRFRKNRKKRTKESEKEAMAMAAVTVRSMASDDTNKLIGIHQETVHTIVKDTRVKPSKTSASTAENSSTFDQDLLDSAGDCAVESRGESDGDSEQSIDSHQHSIDSLDNRTTGISSSLVKHVVHEEHNKPPTLQGAPASKVEGEMVVQRLDLTSTTDELSLPGANRDSSESDTSLGESQDTEPKDKPRDSFFLTASGDEIEAEEPETTKKEDAQNKAHGGGSANFTENTFIGSLARNSRQSEFTKRNRFDTKHQRPSNKPMRPQPGKPNRQQYGRGDNERGRSRQSVSQHTSNSKKNIADKDDGGKEASLHPSWEASRKRKLQETGITAFAGKKISFDD